MKNQSINRATRWGLMAMSLALIVSGGVVWAMGSRVPAVGTPAEDFRLVDLEGKSQSLSQYRGKVVLVNFWATWCKPCTTEMPAMQATYERLRDKGFVVLAINELEDDAKVREHIKQHGHTFPVLMDRENKVANQFGIVGLPVSVFIDEKGVVQEYIKGGLAGERVLRLPQRGGHDRHRLRSHRPRLSTGSCSLRYP
ncbi:MAG: TlpA family protein disulfide reductase [Nitrospira sp.]|nr:TlpA family protein disulfide reductase [Nitrospira sp.]